MKLQLLAVPILVALMLSPAFAAATTGTLTFTSPTSGTQLSGTQSYTISGTISPVPTPGTDNVNIQVTNPSSQLVDVQTVSVSNTGTFSYSTNAGGSSSWTTGTYKISATDSNGASNTVTFAYQAQSQQGSSGPSITIVGNSNSQLWAGQTAQIFALAYWNNNGSAVKTGTWTVTVLGPSGSAPSPSITWTKSSPATGVALWTGSIPTGSSDGVYAVEISDSDSGVTGWTQTAFQVNSQVASASGLSAIAASITSLGKNVTSLSSAVAAVNSAVGSLSSSVNSLTQTVNSVNSAVSGISSSLGSISSTLGTVNSNVQGLGTQLTTLSNNVNSIASSISSFSSGMSTLTNDVTSLQTTVNGLGTLSSDMTSLQSSVSSLSSSVSNAQTYILVVAALAVITLVLELAILIRKMSA